MNRIVKLEEFKAAIDLTNRIDEPQQLETLFDILA